MRGAAPSFSTLEAKAHVCVSRLQIIFLGLDGLSPAPWSYLYWNRQARKWKRLQEALQEGDGVGVLRLGGLPKAAEGTLWVEGLRIKAPRVDHGLPDCLLSAGWAAEDGPLGLPFTWYLFCFGVTLRGDFGMDLLQLPQGSLWGP
jgi:hypothetical protein